MKREIKFRAWKSDTGKMFHLESKVDSHNHYLQCGSDGFWLYRSTDGKLICCSINNDILMQYTGMKDKNGVEIYEGDIVRQSIMANGNHMTSDEGFEGYSQGEVVINTREGVSLKRYFTFNDANGELISSNTKGFKTIASYRSEVVGNMYENPELLIPFYCGGNEITKNGHCTNQCGICAKNKLIDHDTHH